MTFESAFDYYEQVIYDAEALGRHIVKLLDERHCLRVLDCACGTGTPSLQIRSQLVSDPRYTIDCSDGDERMVDQFRRNARLMGVDSACEVRRWEDLDPADGLYDYVMCRGNSLVYGRSWDGGSDVADEGCIADYLAKMASILIPGGYLHIDGPRDYGLMYARSAPTNPPPVSERTGAHRHIDASKIAIRETVTDCDQKRLWKCAVELHLESGRKKTFSFQRFSSKLTLADLKPIMQAAGFDHFETLELEGDRDSGHAALLARKQFG